MKRIFIIISCFILEISLLTACSNNNNSFQENTYTVNKTQVHTININVKDRKIDISPSKDDQIYINYYESDKEYYDISVSDNTLTMMTKINKEWSDYIGSKATSDIRTISMQIPNDLLASMEFTTTNEDIFIPSFLLVENISVLVNNGNIKFEHLNVDNEIRLIAKKGNILGTIIGNYDDFSISSDAKKGKNNLPENKEMGTKKLIAITNGGDIHIEFVTE